MGGNQPRFKTNAEGKVQGTRVRVLTGKGIATGWTGASVRDNRYTGDVMSKAAKNLLTEKYNKRISKSSKATSGAKTAAKATKTTTKASKATKTTK